MSFALHPRLAADSLVLGDLPLCRVLLMNDARYPWLVLVPRRADIREVYQLTAPEQALLWQEVTDAGQQLMSATQGHKLNIAALGNQVPQLHVHVISRQSNDAAWPGPVWGVGTAQAYPPAARVARCAELTAALSLNPR